MAVKVALAAALLVALLAIAGATTFTTTVTTTSFDEEEANRPGQQQCRQQLQGRQFRACQRYLSQSQGPYVEMVTRGQQEAVEECCQSLKEIEQQQPQCGCEAIKKALQQVQQQGSQMGQQGRQMGQAYQKAQQLPQMCNMRSQQCQIRAIFV